MRRFLHTFVTMFCLSFVFVVISCNKDNKDPERRDPQQLSTVSEGTEAPGPNAGNYYFNKISRTLYRRVSGNQWAPLASLPNYKEGAKVYTDNKMANNATGKDGDYFVRRLSLTKNIVYKKKNGAWVEDEGDEIYIPDQNFKNALLNGTSGMPKADTNGNGKISRVEAQSVEVIRVPGKNISSLDGIENFTNLKVLEASNNNLTHVSLNSLTSLTNIVLIGNQLRDTLNLSALSALKAGTEVQIVRDGNNPNIKLIRVSTPAKAVSLNLAEHTQKYSATNETDRNLDLDPILKAAILRSANGSIDLNGDGEISVLEAKMYQGVIKAEESGIQSFKGLEYFEKVTTVQIEPSSGQNTLSTGNEKLSLRGLSGLKNLVIANATLKEIELKDLPQLEKLSIINNNLRSISVVGTPKVTELALDRNNLSEVGTLFTQMTKLTSVNLMGNRLTGNLDLTSLVADLSRSEIAGRFQIVRNCPACAQQNNITSIRVKSAAEANALNAAEGTGVYEAGGGGGNNSEVVIPDQRLKSIVIEKLKRIDRGTYFSYTPASKLYQTDVDKIVDLLTVDNLVTNLAGLQRFTQLKKLILNPTGVTDINITGMLHLEEINLGGSLATVSGNAVNLKKIELPNNHNVRKLNLLGFPYIEQILITEDSNDKLPIECIAVPPSQEAAVKTSLARHPHHQSKVQTTACN